MQSLKIAEIGRSKNIGQDLEHRLLIPQQSLAPHLKSQLEIFERVRIADHCATGRNPAGRGGDAFRHLQIAVAGGTNFRQQSTKQRHQGKQISRQIIHCQAGSEIANTVGRLGKAIQGAASQLLLLAGHGALRRRDITQFQSRQAGQVLFFFLGLLQLFGQPNQLLTIGIAELRGPILQTLAQGLFLLFLQLLIGL